MSKKRSDLISWFTANPVAANLLMLLILIGGTLTLSTIRQEFLPEMKIEQISITIPYPQALPEQVEKQVVERAEAALAGIDGIKNIRSFSYEGGATIIARTKARANQAKIREEIGHAINSIENLPEKTQKPIIKVDTYKEGVLWVIVSGAMSERALKDVSSSIHRDLLSLSGVSRADLEGVRDNEISIELKDELLLEYGLNIEAVSSAIRMSVQDEPLGILKGKSGEILLRAATQSTTAKAFEDMILTTDATGTAVRLRDVAEIKDGFEEGNWFLRFNGERAAGIQVFRVGRQSIQDVAESVKTYVAEKQLQIPENVRVSVIADTSIPLEEQLDTMVSNVVTGAILVFLALSLFLRIKLAFWVVAGIPVCFLGTIWIMDTSPLGLSINMLTLFGFILVIGIVVDDAIVIGEHVHTSTTRDGYGLEQVIQGTKAVALPATFGVLTTIAAFIPVLMLPGVNGQLWGNIGWVVVICLIFSLIESKLILPAHLASMKKERWTRFNYWYRTLRSTVDQLLSFSIKHLYRPSLKWAIKWRYTVIALFLASALITAAMVKTGVVRLVFFPDFESDAIEVELSMPGGTPFGVTSQAAQAIEDAVITVNEQIKNEYQTNHDSIKNVISFSASETSVWFYAELAPVDQRPLSSKEIISAWRTAVGSIPGATRLKFNGVEDEPTPAIDIQLSGTNHTYLQQASQDLYGYLSEREGVHDLEHSLKPGKKELRLSPVPFSQSLGLTISDIASQVRQAVYGEKVHTFQRNGEETEVFVRYTNSQRNSLADLNQIHLNSAEGSLRFADAVNTEYHPSSMEIMHLNRKRISWITGDIDSRITNGGEIVDYINQFKPELEHRYPGISIRFAGQQEEQGDSIKAMKKWSLIALFLIYSLMAIPLRSYVQPFLIMSCIPFGIIGAVWGHYLFNLPLSVLSLCGIIALSGVVVNDSLVMVDFVNSRKRSGKNSIRSITEAGPARFRAILLTSLTTFLGLLPMMLEQSLQAQFLIPMAVSLGFGILFATLITLYLIPLLYLTMEDVLLFVKKFKQQLFMEPLEIPGRIGK
ncbi:MAG: efflux RND transporter permease subunit [Desulfobulbaceae bacterium]|nr:MAG: efflux RND transporter permease subunit [Desulfobulbaceae bacterium]